MKYVVTATINVKRPLVNEDAGFVKDFPMFWVASTTKIKDIRVEKISSVNLVRYLTKLEADVMELNQKIVVDMMTSRYKLLLQILQLLTLRTVSQKSKSQSTRITEGRADFGNQPASPVQLQMQGPVQLIQ